MDSPCTEASLPEGLLVVGEGWSGAVLQPTVGFECLLGQVEGGQLAELRAQEQLRGLGEHLGKALPWRVKG